MDFLKISTKINPGKVPKNPKIENILIFPQIFEKSADNKNLNLKK